MKLYTCEVRQRLALAAAEIQGAAAVDFPEPANRRDQHVDAALLVLLRRRRSPPAPRRSSATSSPRRSSACPEGEDVSGSVGSRNDRHRRRHAPRSSAVHRCRNAFFSRATGVSRTGRPPIGGGGRMTRPYSDCLCPPGSRSAIGQTKGRVSLDVLLGHSGLSPPTVHESLHSEGWSPRPSGQDLSASRSSRAARQSSTKLFRAVAMSGASNSARSA